MEAEELAAAMLPIIASLSGGLYPRSGRLGIQAQRIGLIAEGVARPDQGKEPAASCVRSRRGEVQMTATVRRLLTQKRELLQRLEQNPKPNERTEIEQLLAKIKAALELLDVGGSERE
jgi:hypothetical protein